MIPLRIRTIIPQPFYATVRRWRAITKAATYSVGLKWHDDYLPLHWQPFSKNKYGHKRRSGKWLTRKRKAVAAGKVPAEAAEIDNIFSGYLKDQLDHFAIRAYPTRVTLKATAPQYAPQRPRDSSQPHKIGEIFKVLASENKKLSEQYLATIVAERAKLQKEVNEKRG